LEDIKKSSNRNMHKNNGNGQVAREIFYGFRVSFSERAREGASPVIKQNNQVAPQCYVLKKLKQFVVFIVGNGYFCRSLWKKCRKLITPLPVFYWKLRCLQPKQQHILPACKINRNLLSRYRAISGSNTKT